MAETSKDETLVALEQSNDCKEIFADGVTITGFDTPAGHFVNIAFVAPHVTNLLNEQGAPVAAQISLKKVSSVTMSKTGALAFCEALRVTLEQPPKSGE